MKKLWTMISSLQIVVHYPLLKIPIPPNFLKLLTTIIDIVNMGLLPKKYIKDFINKISKDIPGSKDSRLSSLDIFSKFNILSLFLFLTHIFTLWLRKPFAQYRNSFRVSSFSSNSDWLNIIAQVSLQEIQNVYIAHLISFSVQKLTEKIKDKLIFNAFIRSHIKGFIKMNLAAYIAFEKVSI